MVIHYFFSKRGKSHFAENKPCQDSNCVNVTSSGLTIAAVADGVGSAENSEFGSRIAADTAVGHLSSALSGISPERVVVAELKRAFELAFAAVCKRADTDGKPLSSYDTTLSVAVYDGDTCVYGHSGDGAIVVLTDEGDYVEITTPQKGEDAVSVMPLRAGASYWEFGVYEKPLCSVILMTDGMRDLFCPSLLSRAENNVYVPAATFFADPYLWSKSRHQKNLETAVERFIEADGGFNRDEFFDRIEEIYSHRIVGINSNILQDFKANSIAPDLMDRVEDDKTVVGLINSSKEPAAKELSYYMEPDWMKYKKLRDDVLYGKTLQETPPETPPNEKKPPEIKKAEPPTDHDGEQQIHEPIDNDGTIGGKNYDPNNEVIHEETTGFRKKRKFIIPLIAAGAAAAVVAIAVGVAIPKPPDPNLESTPVDSTIASGSTEETTESDSVKDNANENNDAEIKTTESTTVSTTVQTGTQSTGDKISETTTAKYNRITEESQETEKDNTSSSADSNDESDEYTIDTNESIYDVFLQKKANESKADIYYVIYDCNNDGKKEIIWKEAKKLKIYYISAEKVENLDSKVIEKHFDIVKKTFHYTEESMQ